MDKNKCFEQDSYGWVSCYTLKHGTALAQRSFFMDYKQYLLTPHWQTIRQEKLKKNPFCQICASVESLHVHHKRYTKNGISILFKEALTDLITLCSSCHRLVHHYFGIQVHKINKKICRVRRLIELNVIKKKAFWLAGTEGMWESFYPQILKTA